MLLVVALLVAGCLGASGETSSTPSTAPVPAPTTTVSQAAVTSTTSPAPPVTAPPRPPSTVAAGREYERIPTEERVVALTFDAAYDPSPLPAILDALEEAGIRGTFFLTGEFVEDFPEAVGRIVQGGHPIGNHSYSHPDFTEIGPEETSRQLSRTRSLLLDAGAPDPRPLFRPPFGGRNQQVLARLAEEGYLSVYWTIDTLDWKPERTPEQVRGSVLDGLQPGAIVLMHVGSRQTAEILPRLIEDLRSRGYGFVTVPEGLGL